MLSTQFTVCGSQVAEASGVARDHLRNILILIRVFSTTLQGSWFVSVAVLLFWVTTPPMWARSADGVALLFVWNVVTVGAIGGVVLICCTRPLQNGSSRGSTVEADTFCPLFPQQRAQHFHLCELDEVESAL